MNLRECNCLWHSCLSVKLNWNCSAGSKVLGENTQTHVNIHDCIALLLFCTSKMNNVARNSLSPHSQRKNSHALRLVLLGPWSWKAEWKIGRRGNSRNLSSFPNPCGFSQETYCWFMGYWWSYSSCICLQLMTLPVIFAVLWAERSQVHHSCRVPLCSMALYCSGLGIEL